jgi:hypothetical protein
VDELDIQGLNARVDAMQTRLVYQIQQAYLAREKTRSAVEMSCRQDGVKKRGGGAGEGGGRDEGGRERGKLVKEM